jgi:predicted phage tail component-like protein
MSMKEFYESLPLPDLCMSVNGVYLEEAIIGYRTSSVAGRDELSLDIDEIEIGYTRGARYRKKRDLTRDITVSYALVTDDVPSHTKAINKLKRILHDNNLQLIFRDEDSVYYVGNVSGVSTGRLDAGGSGVIASAGQISIHCSDPYKYSVEEYEAEPTADDNNTFIIDYQGTAEARPIFEVTMNSDNGFIGFMDDEGHILQFGNVDEADKEPYEQNERLGTLWDFINLPNDTNGTDYMHPSHSVKGTLGTSTWFDHTFLTLGVSGPISSSSNGGLRTLILPSDSEGRKGAKNFYSYFHLIFYAGLMGQTGEMCINWLTEDNKLIAGVCWYKTDTTGNTGNYELWANGKVLHTYSYTTSHLGNQNPWYWDWGHCDLRKEGNKLTFYYWGGYPSYIIPEVENMECAKIQIAIKQYGNRGGSSFMTYMGVNDFVFDKMNVEKWRDVPNKFSNGDLFIVDCSTGDVTLKGLPQYGLGALGNDWEKFNLKPGINQIKCVYSEWATKPDFKLKYREAFL